MHLTKAPDDSTYATRDRPANLPRVNMRMAHRSAECDPAANAADKVVRLPLEAVPSAQEDDVEKINPYEFYKLGLEFTPLAEIGRGVDVPTSKAFFPLWTARGTIKRLLDGQPIKLYVSKSAAVDFSNEMETLFSPRFLKEDGRIKFPVEKDAPIESWRWGSLLTCLETFQTVFRAEMENATTYYVPRRGLYSTPDLVESAEDTFPSELAPYISPKTRADFHAAGRCLAFNLPTAAGFHAVRGIEGTIELYWQTFMRQTGTRRGWQDYIDDLQGLIDKKQSPAPAQRTLGALKLIKDHDRNPVMHPRDVVLSEVDARIFFSSSESVILGMAQEIRDSGLTMPAVVPANALGATLSS